FDLLDEQQPFAKRDQPAIRRMASRIRTGSALGAPGQRHTESFTTFLMQGGRQADEGLSRGRSLFQ
ncbi:hypothetical protein, partial [Sinorhizobium meliloti]|uniref:hypothetical protein n=1 Tax=Rhizobium meliloti TaxID=382 RepID=UPI001AEC7C2D